MTEFESHGCSVVYLIIVVFFRSISLSHVGRYPWARWSLDLDAYCHLLFTFWLSHLRAARRLHTFIDTAA
jgi:hypothetical protein